MIRNRLLFGFVLVALLPVLGVGIGTYYVSYQNGKQQSIDRLEAVAARKELAIQVWIGSLQQELQVVSQAGLPPNLVNTTLRLSNEGNNYPWYNDIIRKLLKGFIVQSSQFDEILMINKNGLVSTSTNPAREGQDYSDQLFFQNGLLGSFSRLPFIINTTENPPVEIVDPTSVLIVIPITNYDGQTLGVMAGRANIEVLYSILAENTGLGQTGKAYLVDEYGAVLAGIILDPGFLTGDEENVFLHQNHGIQDAITNKTNYSGIYTGVTDTQVVGIYRVNPDFNAIFAVEQDFSEAFGAVSSTVKLNLTIALIALLLAIAASIYITRSIARPIAELAETASLISRGDLGKKVDIVTKDELGALARAFNSMTSQLSDLINSLEQRVNERTNDLQMANETLKQKALQLQTSAQVGREITSILDIDILLARVVELIQEAFGLYHVQIFLVDSEANLLNLHASSGRREIQHHHLSLNENSINSTVARTGKAMMVNDVIKDSNYLFDQELPDTQSELAIPLRLGTQVIGTLDIHKSYSDAFTEDDILAVQNLGDQIAVAIENAHLYDQSQKLAIMEERSRLSRELHDSVSQSLYSLVLLTEGWRRKLKTSGPGQTDEYLRRTSEIAQQALMEMRLFIHELRPPVLEQEGLVGALQRRLDAVENRVGIESRVVMEEYIELSPVVEEGLYWIAQEALNNSLKHAKAHKVIVHFNILDEQIVLEVIDDGCGFDCKSTEKSGGMGLVNMSERVKQMDGFLLIDSIINKGTTIRASVPFNK